MNWEGVNITTKILHLKDLMNNTSGVFNEKEYFTVNAILTGSMNTMDGDELGFTITNSHMKFLYKIWDTVINNQNDNSVVEKIKKEIK